MAHSARDLLQEEMGKLSRWQVSLADKSGAVYKHVKMFEKDVTVMMEALGNQTGAGEELFKIWEKINDEVAAGKEPDPKDLEMIDTLVKISGGRGDGKGGAVGERGYNSSNSENQHITTALRNWNRLKEQINNDSFNGTFLKQLDIHKLPNWLEDLYDLIVESDYEKDLALMEKSITEMVQMTEGFEERSKKFFDAVPEGQEKIFEKGNKASETAFAKRLLGVGGKENDGALSFSNLRKGSRAAIGNTLSYQRDVLKALQVGLSMINDVCDMGNHFARILHQVAVAAAADMKADNKEVPQDLQEAIEALSPKALKASK